MAREMFVYELPGRFVVGTIGDPGHRTFYLQAVDSDRSTTVALEKEQVAVLASRIEELLDEVVRRSGGTAAVPAVAPVDMEDDEPLQEPVEEEFRVGAMALGWDIDEERVIIEAHGQATTEEEQVEALDDDAEEGPPMLRVMITGGMARAFAK